ncbi:MAG: TonB-dependent receptor [Gammaproteobacteria bacterium]|nr:TonB-dependent receptor [Gammaproteobacteria bacterium]
MSADTEYRDSESLAFSPTDNMWGGQLSANFFLSPSTLIYASLSRGYKAGGFNTDGSLDEDLREFDPEYLWELETGIKTTLADGRMRLRGAVFYDARRDQQVKSSIVRRRPNDSTEFIDFLGNAAEGTNRGVELQVDWLVSEPVTLFANIGYLDADSTNSSTNLAKTFQAESRRRHRPGWQASAPTSRQATSSAASRLTARTNSFSRTATISR